MALLDALGRKGIETAGLHERRMQAYRIEAIAHHYAGRYAPALAGFQGMEREADTLGRVKDVAAALTYEGYEYRATGDLDRAGAVTLRAIAILRGLPEGTQLANALAGMGTIYSDRLLWDSSMYYQRASAAMQRRLGNAVFEALSQMDIAVLYTMQQRYDSAYATIQLAKPALMADPNIAQQVILLVQEARILIGLGRIPEARRNLDAAWPLARQVGANESIQHLQDLESLVAASNGKFMDAIRAQDSARQALLQDLDLAKVQEVAAVRLEGEHAKERAVAQARMDAVQRQKRYVLIGSGLLVVIAALLLLQLITVRRKNAAIVRAHQQVIEAEKQRENEQVRTRIARDIHDDIGSGLTKIALLSAEAKQRVKDHTDELRATLDRITTHSREVSAALSDIVWSVDPAQDTSVELVVHAHNVARRLLDGSPVRHDLRFNHRDPATAVAPGTKHHIVMVMKEAINNALKYAKPAHITVTLEAGAGSFRLEVQDDGQGFDPDALAHAGNGLRNMQARAEAIGATFRLESAPGKGCTVRVEGALN
jgi:signal transduction histidine kinase